MRQIVEVVAVGSDAITQDLVTVLGCSCRSSCRMRSYYVCMYALAGIRIWSNEVVMGSWRWPLHLIVSSCDVHLSGMNWFAKSCTELRDHGTVFRSQNVAKFPLLHRGPFVTTLHTQHLLVNASWCFCNNGRSERPELVLTASPTVRHIWVIKSNCLRVGLRLSILFFMESNLHIAKKLEKKTLIYWRVSTVAHYALGHGH
jgi:hypothetical protein